MNVVSLRGGPEPSIPHPPVNLEAEQALLGAMLINPPTIDRVIDRLKPDYFADPLHAKIYATIARLILISLYR